MNICSTELRDRLTFTPQATYTLMQADASDAGKYKMEILNEDSSMLLQSIVQLHLKRDLLASANFSATMGISVTTPGCFYSTKISGRTLVYGSAMQDSDASISATLLLNHSRIIQSSLSATITETSSSKNRSLANSDFSTINGILSKSFVDKSRIKVSKVVGPSWIIPNHSKSITVTPSMATPKRLAFTQSLPQLDFSKTSTISPSFLDYNPTTKDSKNAAYSTLLPSLSRSIASSLSLPETSDEPVTTSTNLLSKTQGLSQKPLTAASSASFSSSFYLIPEVSFSIITTTESGKGTPGYVKYTTASKSSVMQFKASFTEHRQQNESDTYYNIHSTPPFAAYKSRVKSLKVELPRSAAGSNFQSVYSQADSEFFAKATKATVLDSVEGFSQSHFTPWSSYFKNQSVTLTNTLTPIPQNDEFSTRLYTSMKIQLETIATSIFIQNMTSSTTITKREVIQTESIKIVKPNLKSEQNGNLNKKGLLALYIGMPVAFLALVLVISLLYIIKYKNVNKISPLNEDVER